MLLNSQAVSAAVSTQVSTVISSLQKDVHDVVQIITDPIIRRARSWSDPGFLEVKNLRLLKGHAHWIFDIDVNENGILTGSEDATAKFWSLNHGSLIAFLWRVFLCVH